MEAEVVWAASARHSLPFSVPRKSPPRRQRSSLFLHGIVALICVFVLATVLLFEETNQQAGSTLANVQESVSIAIEHTSPLTFFIASTVNTDPGIIDFWHSGEETVFLSVPDSWVVREVRHGALDALSPAPASGGFHRYPLPRGVTVSFSGTSPLHLLVHNPSAIPLHVHYKRIQLEKDRMQEGSVLVGERPGQVW